MHSGKLSVRYGVLRELIGLLVFFTAENKYKCIFTEMHLIGYQIKVRQQCW